MLPQNLTTPAIQAAGGVILHPQEQIPHTVIIHRPKYDDWSLPKGKVDPGERFEETALREVREETFLECVLKDQLSTQYYPQDHKIVHYWVMRVMTDHGFTPNDEVDQLQWVPLAQAPELLDYQQDRHLVAEVLRLYGAGRMLTAK